MELVWTVGRNEDLDIYQFARNLMTNAIDCLKKDGHLQAGVFIISKKKIYCLAVQFEGYEQKLAEYDKAVDFARSKDAVAIVTLNDTFFGDPEDAENYYPGKFKELNKYEGIWITVTGPKMKNWSLSAKYERKGLNLVFAEPKEEFGGDVNFLQDWPARIRSVN
jgi:hypothetical protein